MNSSFRSSSSAYIPITPSDRKEMLESIGVGDLSELLDQAPRDLQLTEPLNVAGPFSEMELFRHAEDRCRANIDAYTYACFLGAGIYDHYIPATVPAITGRSEFYTSYTPYQPEISQGDLQSIFEFQSLVCQLTGMEVANASMYDGATATVEAALMASSITGRDEWVVSGCLNPSYREVLGTYAWGAGYRVVDARRDGLTTDPAGVAEPVNDKTACVIIQNPNFLGAIEDLREVESAAHSHGALFIVVFQPISLGLLRPPGEYNADIAVGEGQPLGIPMWFGGPLLGLFACKRRYVRQMPGRLAGMTVDTEGRRGYTLTLQTREQHIRREKATSNICTNEALNALAATVYLSTLGKTGLRHVADLCLQKAHFAADAISRVPGCEVPFASRFFNEFVVKLDRPFSEVNARLLDRKIVGGLDLGAFGLDLANHMLLCVTEKRTVDDINALVEGLSE